MSKRHGLTNLAADARMAIHRLIAGLKVIEVPSIVTRPLQDSAWSINPRLEKLDSPIQSNASDIQFGIAADSVRKLPAIAPSTNVLKTSFIARSQAIEIVNSNHVRIFHESCELPQLKLLRISGIEIPKPAGKNEQLRITTTKVICALPDVIHPGKIFQVPPCGQFEVRREIDAILAKPMIRKSTPWSCFEREFIVKCWNLLNEKARKQGITQARDLEMLGIFPNIDLAHVRKTRFDPGKREIHLFVHSSENVHKLKTSKCAIIFGSISGTGVVLQVAIPM